ncbi:MAG: dihydroorotate dehydrogenase electron transfer subunit [Candidatus Omnitrophica bacterium]|nr:dihydroorotate dehydrogenase electron transfer subunit [Candidatus Omnitrophota bacterium]
MVNQFVTVLENRKVNGQFYKLIFRCRALAKHAKPGQFVNLLVNVSYDPFLRRPFSFYRTIGDRIEILYEVLGRGTALLANKKKGEALKVMGPLGRGFKRIVKNKKRILVGGGIGVPPLVFLGERTVVDYFLIGAKSYKEVLPAKELSRVHGKILYSTNDGSYGAKGYVTGLLEQLLRKESPQSLFIQTCGPRPMVQAVMEIARQRGIEGEVSLDETMACGVGACLGCVVETREGWVPSCTHGPVFAFKELR